MTEPVSQGRVNEERVDEKCTTDNSIEIQGKAKPKLVFPNSRNEKADSLQDKQCREHQGSPVNIAKEP
jgi:hypothetical protein